MPNIDYSIEIQKSEKFESHEGDRNSILNSFCEYSNSLNPKDDIKDPRHWDIGILVTGLDMWMEDNGVRNDDTLGVARTRGMCHSKYSCAVGKAGNNYFFNKYFLHLVEFGAIGAIGTNYPTTGFGAAYTLAHEIGISIILAS